MNRFRMLLCLLSCLFAPVVLRAQTPDATLGIDASDPSDVTFTPSGLTQNGTSLVPFPTFNLQINCLNGTDCTNVTVDFNGTSHALTTSGEIVTLTLPTIAGTPMQVQFQDTSGTSVFSTTLEGRDDGTDGSTDTEEVPLDKLLQNPCTSIVGPVPTAGYSRRGNLISMIVAPTGRVLAAPIENMDEDDVLELWILADSGLAPLLNAKRKSPIRTVGSLQIVGAGVTIHLPATGAQAARGPAPCTYSKFILNSFAPGRGEVEISVAQGAQPVVTGNFDFVVDQLYDGLFSFGAVRSDVVDRTFKLTPQGSDKVIYASEDGDHQTLYAVFYTPFVWGKRDIEKRVENPLHRLNPTFGFSVNNFGDNALVGLSYDFARGFVLLGGVHFSRVKTLSGKSGLKEGSPFTGEESEIPTEKSWDQGVFFGVSIDLRAASQLLQTVFGTGSGNP